MQAIAFKGLLRSVALASSVLMLGHAAAHARPHGGVRHGLAGHHRARAYVADGHRAHVIQCVAFARSDTDIALSGNAANWWRNAEGVYARGSAPEPGSVLNFRANARMRLGHVAVVTGIVDSRTIQIDQSHWNANGISRDVTVVDVSENNDWTAVRVALGHTDGFGAIYPTYGFIYPRPDTGRIVTARGDAAAPRRAGTAPADLRGTTEVAEAPPSRGIDLSVSGLSDDAPDRGLR